MATEERKSFIFYKSWAEQISELDDQTRLKFLDAIIAYATEGTMPEAFSKMETAVFKGMQDDIDRNENKREEIKKRRSEAGKKGGYASGVSRAKQNEANEANASFVKQNEANEANPSINVNDDVDVDVNGNVDVNVSPIRGDIYNIAPPPYESLVNSQEIVQKARDFIQFYNQQVQGTHLPTARITDTRIMKTAHILAKIGAEDMRDAIIKASQSILAKEPSGIGYDWFTNEDNIVKVIEGNYDNTRTNTQSSGLRSQEARRRLQLQQLARGDEQLLADLEATLQNGG